MIKINDTTKNYLMLAGRILIGMLFIYSGFTKLTRPIEYFEAIIIRYEIMPGILVSPLAMIVPWAELVCGTFFLLGLDMFVSGVGLTLLTAIFQMALAQAILRDLPLDECGCFGGDFVKLTLLQSFLLDTVIVVSLIFISAAEKHFFSLDRFLIKKARP